VNKRSKIFAVGIVMTMAAAVPTIAAAERMSQGMDHNSMTSGMAGKPMMSHKRMKMHRMTTRNKMMMHDNKMHASKGM
jgi:hypothetical protein